MASRIPERARSREQIGQVAEGTLRVGIDGTFLEGDSLHTGMGSYTLGLTRGLASLPQPHELTLLGYGERPEVIPENAGWRRLLRFTSSRWVARVQHQIAVSRAVRGLDLQLLHVPGLNVRLSRPGIPISPPCPLVVTIHDAIPLAHYGRELLWRLRLGFWLGIQTARNAARIITVSETSRRDLLELTSLSARRIEVIYNGVEQLTSPPKEARVQILKRFGIAGPYLLYAGSYEPRKNLLAALQAYQAAASQAELPPLSLLVERESGYRDGVIQRIEASGISDRVRILHSLHEGELAAVYAEATLLIYPSLYEGFGLPPLEAMSLGVPVIASNRGSLPEVLGDAAHFVDPESTGSMAEAILTVTGDPAYAQRLSRAGRIQAQRFRWESAARKTSEIYKQVVGEERSRRPDRETRNARTE